VLRGLTAFVAVDTTSRTSGDHRVALPVPVPVPDGVRRDAAVGRSIAADAAESAAAHHCAARVTRPSSPPCRRPRETSFSLI